MVRTSPGYTDTTTEVAVLPDRVSGLWLRYLAARMRTLLELKMESARLGKSSSGTWGRKAIGREWMVSWNSLGARRKGNKGESPTGNDLLSGVVRVSKYGAKAAAGVEGLETRRVTKPLSLTLVVTARGRVQFASRRRRATMSGKVTAIREACSCSEGVHLGA